MTPSSIPAEELTTRGLRTRERILAAARSVLADHGHLDLSLVSAAAGISPGLPFRYFETRSALLEAVVEDFHTRLSEAAVFRDFEGATWQLRERQRVRAWVKFLTGDPLSPIVLSGVGGDPIVTSALERRHRLAVEFGARNMARGQADGEVVATADPYLLAAGVLGGVQSMVVAALLGHHELSPDHLTEQVWEFVARAAGASQE